MKTVLVILVLFLLGIAAKGITSRHSPKYRIKHYHYHHRPRLPRVLNRPKVHIAPQPIILPEIKHFYHYCSDHPQSIEHSHIPTSEHSFQVPKATIIRPPFSLNSETGPASGEYFKNFEHLINVVGNQHESEPPTHHQEPHGLYEFVEIPDVHSPPLEDDPTKATYDTPGAVNSYGSPVVHQMPNLIRKEPKKRPTIEEFFEVELNDDFHPQYEYKRTRKQSKRTRNYVGDAVRHPNHRYD